MPHLCACHIFVHDKQENIKSITNVTVGIAHWVCTLELCRRTCACLTMLILKASVPDLLFRADDPLTQQYLLRRCSLVLSCTCFMVAPKSTPPLLLFVVGPLAKSLKCQRAFCSHEVNTGQHDYNTSEHTRRSLQNIPIVLDILLQ